MNTMTYFVLSTWVFALLGWFVNPLFFVAGMTAFIIAAIIWTVGAVKNKASPATIAMVWGIPIVMGLLLGVALMWLPPTEQ